MKTGQIILAILAVGLSRYLACADGLINNSTNMWIVRQGSYTYTLIKTNKYSTYVNPSEFWRGTWKEDTNGWRVQLRVYPETNFRYQDGVAYPLSTNLILIVEWGSAVKNSWGSVEKPSGEKYFRTPNGKFAKFELSDAKGNVIPPNPNAGTNLLLNLIKSKSLGGISQGLAYETNLPTWVSPASGSLVSNFPKTISANVYPHF